MTRHTSNSLVDLLSLPAHILIAFNSEVVRQLEEEKNKTQDGNSSLPSPSANVSSAMSGIQSQVSNMMGTISKPSI